MKNVCAGAAAPDPREGLRRMLESLPPFVSPRQLADITGQNVGSIRRGIAEGRIVADKVNGRFVIPVALILANTAAAVGFGEGAEGGEGGDAR